MQVIAKRALVLFWAKHPKSETPLRNWHARTKAAKWSGPQDVKDMFGSSVDFVADNRAIFDIGGNNYRLVVHISYRYSRVLIKFAGTHAEYDKIDPEKV